MKKLLLVLVAITLVTGCGLFGEQISPTRSVETFLGKYQSLNEEVTNQLDDVVLDEELTTVQRDEYNEVMRRQYQNLTYTIKEEIIDGDNAIVTAEIEVYDLKKTQADVEEYLATNETEFEDETGTFSQERYMDYMLEQLKNETSRVKYTLDLRLTKEDEQWIMEDLTEIERQKIHGVYET